MTKPPKYHPNPYDIVREFRKQPPEQFDAVYWRKRFATEFPKYLDYNKEVGISDEELANGGIMHNDPTMLKWISSVFGEIKVIIVLRHPIQYLRST